MSATPTFDYEHRVEENVVVQDLTGWTGETEGMEQVESEWQRHASRSGVNGSVTEFGPGVSLGRETQEHLAEEWSENAQAVGIDRVAFVSEGAKAMAVSANLDVPQEVRTFDDLDEAIEWAQG